MQALGAKVFLPVGVVVAQLALNQLAQVRPLDG